MAHPGLPRPGRHVIRKADLLAALQRIDRQARARKRVLAMDTEFGARIDRHIASLPPSSPTFEKLKTSPYVLLVYAAKHGYTRVSEIEADILPAKLFSSMETSTGKMIEAVTLPVYGWECVDKSRMHSPNSALDGLKAEGGAVQVATLKSGPRCLNDEMAENFADAILVHAPEWAREAGVNHVKFTYGVLYGTPRQSNKKDWHILGNISKKASQHRATMLSEPAGRWECALKLGKDLHVDVAVRVGSEWWSHLGGDDCALELWVALIRACVKVGQPDPSNQAYTITDLASIVSTDDVPADFNVSLLQRSQVPWLFFVARHFCDDLV